LTTRHKEDRAAKLLGQRQQFKVAAFPPSQAVKARWAGPQITSVLPTRQQPDAWRPIGVGAGIRRHGSKVVADALIVMT
jgi:hypothetical protein